MKSARLAVLTVLAGFSPAAAQAADLFTDMPPSGYQWSGFYVGVGAGAGAVVHQLDVPALGGFSFNGIGGEGIFGEVSIGYDHLFGERFLVGLYGTGRFGNIETSLNLLGLSGEATLEYGFDVMARAGFLLSPRTLAYVLGGYSFQHFDISTNVGLGLDWDDDGFVVGAGVETAVNEKLSAKIEYRYADYGGDDLGSGGLVEVSPSVHTVMLGLNYRFFGTADTPEGTFAAPAPLDWTGFFLGASVGGAGLVHDLSSPLVPGGFNFNGIGGEGVFGTIGGGYDHQFGNWFVAGIEGRARLSGVETELSIGGFSAKVEEQYGFDIVGRLGARVNDWAMVYGLGGYTWTHFDVNATGFGSVYDWDAHGFVVGAGIEAAVSEHVFAGLEYRYADYGDEDFFNAGVLVADPSSHSGQLTLKYKF